MPRLRTKFSRGEELKFLSHLDITRLWQRAFQRAGIPLSYSHGFNPHPRLALAAPLAVGMVSRGELMDVWCDRPISSGYLISAVNRQLPRGIEMLSAYQLAPFLPSLQSQVRYSEYCVLARTEKNSTEINLAIERLLALRGLAWQHQRDTGVRHYDLRALIDSVWLTDCHDGLATLGMKLRCDSRGAGRPEQVTLALGFNDRPELICRERLILNRD